MSERQGQLELEAISLGHRSLQGWHLWLTCNRETGDYEGDLAVPCSRYGRTSEEVAWWAIAGEVAFDCLGGVAESPEEWEAGMDSMMSDVVNDQGHVAAIIAVAWPHLPEALKAELGELSDVTERLYDQQ